MNTAKDRCLWKPGPVLPKEHPVLLHIWELSVSATHRFLQEPDIVFFKDIICQDNLFASSVMTVARSESGAIAGFIGTSGSSLDMLFLHPQRMGQGVGKMLITHAIANLGVTEVDVNEQNTKAVNFYRHFGFEVIARSECDGTGKPYPLLHMRLNPLSWLS